MKKNRSLLEYTRDNVTQVSEFLFVCFFTYQAKPSILLYFW